MRNDQATLTTGNAISLGSLGATCFVFPINDRRWIVTTVWMTFCCLQSKAQDWIQTVKCPWLSVWRTKLLIDRSGCTWWHLAEHLASAEHVDLKACTWHVSTWERAVFKTDCTHVPSLPTEKAVSFEVAQERRSADDQWQLGGSTAASGVSALVFMLPKKRLQQKIEPKQWGS